MKLIFAQGNPDQKYLHTRHNVGFQALDHFAEGHANYWKDIDKYRARVSEVIHNGEKVLLVKPLSYYNDTGAVARQLLDYYKLDPSKDFLVIHDELALPFGTIRVRKEGSDAGNNGIKSLNTHLGSSYARIRIGVWNDLRDRMDDVDFVLGNFSSREAHWLQKLVFPEVDRLINAFLEGTLEASSVNLDSELPK